MSSQDDYGSHSSPQVQCGFDITTDELAPTEDPFYDYDLTPNYAYRHTMSFGANPQPQTTFGGFTAKELAITGGLSYLITRWLGASVPGAIIMGVGNMLWEAGSSNIAPGWKRYILGLFRKPHE